MRYPFSQKEIPRRKFLLWLNKWQYREARGAYWWSFAESFVNWKQLKDLLLGGGMVKLLFPSLALWKIMVIGVIFFVGGAVLMRVIKIIIGIFDIKYGVPQIQSEFRAKTAYVNPVGIENIKTIESIAKKVGAKSYFKHLYRGRDDYKEVYKKDDTKK